MTKLWRVHTVVFDVDDTLYAERDYVLSGIAAADHWLAAERGVHGFGQLAMALFENGRRGTIFDETLREIGIEPAAELVASLVWAYRQHTPRLQLAEDAEAILPWLAQRFRLAALTDGYAEVQWKKFTALNLSRWIEFCVVTDELGRGFWKPHPAGFERIMKHFGGAASGFVYVADNPRKDFIAPKALGWRTVRLRRLGGEHVGYVAPAAQEADTTMSDLRELMDLFVRAEVRA